MGELWSKANLPVKNLYVAIPDVHDDQQENIDQLIMNVLKCQNEHLNVRAWKIVKKTKLKESEKILITLVIDKESKGILEANPFLYYGMRCCKVNVSSNPNQEVNFEELVEQLADNHLVEVEQGKEKSSENLQQQEC